MPSRLATPRIQVHDTSVWIPLLNAGDPDVIGRLLASPRVWLSSVVIAELRAGTRSQEDGELVDAIVGPMRRSGRILVPTDEDWELAGTLIARRVRQVGTMNPRQHMADALITVSTGRRGGTIITQNVDDFNLWAGMARRAKLGVQVRCYVPAK